MLINTRTEVGTSQRAPATEQPDLAVAYVPYHRVVSGPRHKPFLTTTGHSFKCLVDDMCKLKSEDTQLAVFLPAGVAVAHEDDGGKRKLIEHGALADRQAAAVDNIARLLNRWQDEFGIAYYSSRGSINTVTLPVDPEQLSDQEQVGILVERVFTVCNDGKVPIAYEDPQVSFTEDSTYEQQLAERFAAVLHNSGAFGQIALLKL